MTKETKQETSLGMIDEWFNEDVSVHKCDYDDVMDTGIFTFEDIGTLKSQLQTYFKNEKLKIEKKIKKLEKDEEMKEYSNDEWQEKIWKLRAELKRIEKTEKDILGEK